MLTHTELSCCHKGCYAIITLHPDDERRLRQTHERFWCPAGHGQSFIGKTDEQKRIEQLERRVESSREDVMRWMRQRNDLHAALKSGPQVCPFGCGWHGKRRLPWHPSEADLGRFFDRVYFDLGEHLQREHGASPTTVRQIPEKTGAAL
jgi:hypothetical protein